MINLDERLTTMTNPTDEPGQDEKVYQASPSMCVKTAREYLRAARSAALDGDADKAADDALSAIMWLPGFLEREWDDRMAAYMLRAGVESADQTTRSPNV